MRKPPPRSAVPHKFIYREVVRHPSAILFVTQLLGVLLYAVDEATGSAVGWQVALELFGAGVLALAIWAVRDQPGPTWMAVILGVAASGLSVLAAVTGSDTIGLVGDLVHAAFYFLAAASMLTYMLADSDVTHDELWAVGATFTLVAWAFAYVFSVVQQLGPGSFIDATAPDAPRSWLELLFLSFTNLSSTGLSDVVPVLPVARAVVMIEQLAGLAYVALFVSRVVGLTINRRRMTRPEAGEDGQRERAAAAPGPRRDR